jgi:hypothetical protein
VLAPAIGVVLSGRGRVVGAWSGWWFGAGYLLGIVGGGWLWRICPWGSDGGATSVKDCLLLCQYHHDICIHRWGWEIELLPDGTVRARGR